MSQKELLACVDRSGVPTKDSVVREDFYSGKCPNKNVCGIAYWVFSHDELGSPRLLLTKRSSQKENKPGRISPPSQHLIYLDSWKTAVGRLARKLFPSAKNADVFLDFSFNLPNSSMKLGPPLENCWMAVKNCAILIPSYLEDKVKISSDHVVEQYFVPWREALKGILSDEIETFWATPDNLAHLLDHYINNIKK